MGEKGGRMGGWEGKDERGKGRAGTGERFPAQLLTGRGGGQ